MKETTQTNQTALQSRLARPEDYPQLMTLWEASVKASHQFLTAAEISEIKTELLNYFQAVELRIWYQQPAEWIAFSGVSEGHLEMLFLAPQFFRQGYGSELINQLVAAGVTKVDVNEENQIAQKFYQANGFSVIDRSETDGQGRPHPILHLAR